MSERALEATHLRDRRYAVRPAGACGTCGWVDGVAWTVCYVNANNPNQAIAKALWEQGGPFHEGRL